MVVSGFSDGSGMFDITPVENMFIAEYMGKAKGDFVKVYLLGLKLCYYKQDDYGTAEMARDLDLDEDTVKDAFVYWAQSGLVEILSRRPFNVRYNNIKHVFQNNDGAVGQQYVHQDLIMQLQSLFGGRRILGGGDVSRVMEWVEELRLPHEVVTLVTAWCVQTKGKRVAFKHIDSTMRFLVDKDITTYEKAERYIKWHKARNGGAAQILERWNVNRTPTDDELELYDKWTVTYSYSDEIIGSALKEMTGITRPNFKYLDKILESWYQRGLRTAEDVLDHADTNAKSRDAIKSILLALGAPSSITPEIQSMYDIWVEDGFSSTSMLKAAAALSGEGHTKAADLNALLSRWRREGITDDEDVQAHIENLQKIKEAFGELLGLWGEQRAPLGSERRAYLRWQELGYSHELILAAAEAAANANARLPYMEKILSSWAAEGITDPDDTQKATRKVKRNHEPGENIIEHQYSEADYNAMYDSLEDA